MLPLAGAPGLSYKNLLLGKSKISEQNFPPILYQVLQSPQWIMHSVFFCAGLAQAQEQNTSSEKEVTFKERERRIWSPTPVLTIA